MDITMCKDCQALFDKQHGQLLLMDMCEVCKAKHVVLILQNA